ALGDLLARERAHVVAVVEVNASGAEVVLAEDARAVEMRRVRGRADAVRAFLAERALVLGHRRSARRVAVLAVAVGLVKLGAREGVLAGLLRAPGEERALRAEAARRVLRGEAALRETELVVRAACDGVVALARIE